jgi:hypothetical protein
MCRKANLHAAGFLLLLSIQPLGCQKVYRSETTWQADVSVDRAIYQEWEATPKEVRRRELWQQATAADKTWSGLIRNVPLKKRGEEGPYFAAWGRFKSPQDLPAHFILRAAQGAESPESRLIRECRWTDYAFVREYRWRETLTDVVKFEDMQQARGQLADLLIDLYQDCMNKEFPRDYDATDLVKWLREEGKAWLAEMTDYAFIHAAVQKGPASFRALANGLAEICDRHGLALKIGGKLLEGQELDHRLKDFASDKIAQHVRRRRDGKLVDKKTAEMLRAALDRAFNEVIDRKYGGQQYEKMLTGLLIRVVGLHCSQLFQQNDFDYSLTVPGHVVSTNGQILSRNRVRWQFDEREAYPLGYVMECRSLLSDPKVQTELLHNQPLTSRETMLRFVALVSESEPLGEALQQCRKRKNMGPLYEYRQKRALAEGELETVNQVLKLIGLPERPE